jgi:DUF1680 family protein
MTWNSIIKLTSLVLFLSLTPPSYAAPTDRNIIQPFDYKGVTLEDGPLKRQFDETRDYYLRIPNDDLLKGFRARAGRPAPGVDLGGWYTADIFHVFGQILSGLERMYAATGDTTCRDKALTLIHEWGQCIEPDGYFFYSRTPNVYHYTYEKMAGGLVDAIVYCKSREAATYLSRITDWAIKHLDRKRPYGADGAEWYTLSENLYRAYLATGDTKYKDFAVVWEYRDYWDVYARNGDIHAPLPNGKRIGAYHAYSHVNTLSGAGAAYRVKGDRHYLDTLINAYNYLQNDQCFATGGYGPDEQLLPHDARIRLLGDTHNTFETQCGSWAGFKMSKYLLSFTGDAKYGDWVERLVINGIGASIPMSADGHVFYYSDYNTANAAKRNTDFGWSCCTGTRPMAVADYHDLIYFKDAGSLYVNLYTPSTVRWERPGGVVTVRQRTRFPERETVEFTVDTAKPVNFGLRFRVPGWLTEQIRVTVNGKIVPDRAEPGHWMSVYRTWRAGDHVSLTLPLNFQVSHLDSAHPYPAAILHGPVVMAFRSPRNPSSKVPLESLAGAFLPEAGEALTYHLASDPALLLRPFYAYKEAEPYYLYLDPKAANRIPYRDVTFSPGWNESGLHRFSRAIGAMAEYTFEGTGIRWRGWKYDDAGHAEVRIDGKVVAEVDQYGPGRELPFDWKIEGLPFGKHTIKITVLPNKTEASKDHYLNVAGFEIIRP